MTPELHSELITQIERLRVLLAAMPTGPVVLQCRMILDTPRYEVEERYGLVSPLKQIYHILGLLLTSPEPNLEEIEFEKHHWLEALRIARDIFAIYATMFFSTDGSLDVEAHRRIGVSMRVFLHYYNTGILITPEQMTERVRDELVPFDAQLQELVGISASEALEIVEWIVATLDAKIQKFFTNFSAGFELWTRKVEELREAGTDDSKLLTEPGSDPEIAHLLEQSGRPDEYLIFCRSELHSKFGADATSRFWDLFVAQRSASTSYTYPTDTSPCERKPLIEVATDKAICLIGNTLFTAVYLVMRSSLEGSADRDKYQRCRDQLLEGRVQTILGRFWDGAGVFLPSVYETQDCRFEHDLVIVWNRAVFVFESKASPLRPPFRDPARAYERIERWFGSDRSVQSAYDQANRIREALITQRRALRLFDERGQLVCEIAASDVDEVYCVCVSADDLGALNTDLSMLLHKKTADPYPWAVNVFDLDTFVGGLQRKGWGPEMLQRYIAERRLLHGRVHTTDELEIGGLFVKHGNLSALRDRADDEMIMMSPDFARVFDEIWDEKHGGSEACMERSGDVVFADVTSIFKDAFSRRSRGR